MTDVDTEAALLRAVLDRPGDDLPRLVYADWLDEQGTPEATARAEFIRRGVALAIAGKEDPFLAFDVFGIGGAKRFGMPGGWFMCGSVKKADLAHRNDPTAKIFLARRGFVDEIRLPLAAFLGGRCPACDVGPGVRRYPTHSGNWIEDDCNECYGTGTRPGLDLAAVFGRHPLSVVRPTDVDDCLQQYEPGRWFWRDDGVFDHQPLLPAAIAPKDVYDSREDAYAALSASLVALGRAAANLPPLP